MELSGLAPWAVVAAAACPLSLHQGEQAVSDLQRGGAVWDGERVLAQETRLPGEVRAQSAFFCSSRQKVNV